MNGADRGGRILGVAVVLSLAIVTSIITSTVVASRAYVQRGQEQSRGPRDLNVTGSAKKRIVSDLALWSIRVAGEAATLEEAFTKLSDSTLKVREFLSQQGFPEAAVSLGPIHTVSHRRRDEKGLELPETIAFELWRTFSIRTNEVNRIAQAAGQVTELLKGGARVESLAPDYVFTGLQDLKIEMLGLATADARQRAERIAAESRCRIGEVREARAGVLQITPPWSTDVSSSGINDTSSIEKDITSVVHLNLEIVSE